ncbi:uncharacterized protein LOC106650500 isoform X2 [Trichogramma pretiosum]|nr:uncharacterized protein LOC106650500 isoform X2 [Trichogramma pretiosum]
MLRVLGVRLLSRLLVLVCSLSLLSLLFLSRCGFNSIDTDLDETSGPATLSSASLSEVNQRDEETKLEIDRLTAEIRALKLQILQLTGGPPGHGYDSSLSMLNSSDIGDCLAARRQIDQAEINQGLPLNNEYELIPFSHFTLARLYPSELGLGKRVVEKPIGFRQKDFIEAVAKALEVLNRNATNQSVKYTEADFLEGLYRIEPTTGTQYEMYFKTKNLNKSSVHASSSAITSLGSYTKISLIRPFAPLQFVKVEKRKARDKELVHIILPLSGRTSTFQSFMDKFVKIALQIDRRVHLTVVYFGTEGLSEARAIMSRVLMTRGSGGTNQNLRLLALNETFSRGKGLRVGAERAWGGGNKDVLLFMCDVDIVFSTRFLDRCRWNTSPSRKVYYPIVFSLYNPHVVYTLQGRNVPPETDQLVISRDTGFWRDFGYGMTCQYRSDFLRVRGFDENIVGWGGEDVTLYRKYVRSNIKVVRATDPGIYHIWHPKLPRIGALLVLLLTLIQLKDAAVIAESESTTIQPSASATLGTLFRQARADYAYGTRFGSGGIDEGLISSRHQANQPIERDAAYFEERCITCDTAKAAAALTNAEREPYPARLRQRVKYDYYDDEVDDRRFRGDRIDGYYNDRSRAPSYDYDKYDPFMRNELFRPTNYNDRYDPYERDRYYPRPTDRQNDRPSLDRPYDRSYERGNGYDNLDGRYPNYDDRYDRYGPGPASPSGGSRRPPPPPYDEYGPPRYDRYNGNARNYGRYDSRYDRYEPYERNGYHRRPAQPYDDRYDDRYGGERYPGTRLPGDSRGYYGGAAGAWQSPGISERPGYANSWNYPNAGAAVSIGGSRDNSWRDVNRDRDNNRDRDRDRERDRDSIYYRPRDYFYDSTAAPGGSRGTSFLYDRGVESSTPKPDADKPTNSPQTQDNNKNNYKD